MKQVRRLHKETVAIVLLAITGLACAIIPGLGNTQAVDNGNKPAVALSNPIAGQKLQIGQETDVQSVSVDETGITRVELLVDGEVIWIDANAKPEPEAPFIVVQPWTPKTPGAHVIRVRAYNTANVAGESSPLTVEAVIDTVTNQEATATSVKPVTLGATSANTPTPTNTASPTAAPEPISDTALPLPTVTNTPTATPQPQIFSPTGLEPNGRFKDIWFELGRGTSRLGYPTGPEINDRNYAKQSFENGLMIWWDNPDDPDYIWAIDSPADDFKSGETSNRYPDTWEAGSDEYSCDRARIGGPIRGFGKVWCEWPELQARLGYPQEPEAGSGGRAPYAHVQFFQGGVFIYTPLNKEVYVLFAQGDWQRFDY